MVRDSFLENNTKDQLTFVEDGRELMDYLLRQGKYNTVDQKLPGLILLDLNMPKMDGREALREIKSTPSLCHIPVLIFTTSKADEDIYNAYRLGANSFILKPVTYQGLVETVAKKSGISGLIPPCCPLKLTGKEPGSGLI